MEQAHPHDVARIRLGLQVLGAGSGGSSVARALQRRCCAKLTHLDLSINCIGNEGCARLALSLSESCPNLRSLGLDCNGIGFLPDSLGQLRSLTSLNIGCNNITRIQPALYDLILQLKWLSVYRTPLCEERCANCRYTLYKLKHEIRGERR